MTHHGMNWTPRMTDVDEAEMALMAEWGRATLKAIGHRVGLSVERTRQLRCKIARWHRIGAAIGRQQDQHVRLWRHLMGEALEALQRGLKTAGWQRWKASRPAKPRKLQQEDWHVIDYTLDRRRQRWAEQTARDRRLKNLRSALAQALHDEMREQLASDPKLRQLDQWARALVRKDHYRG